MSDNKTVIFYTAQDGTISVDVASYHRLQAERNELGTSLAELMQRLDDYQTLMYFINRSIEEPGSKEADFLNKAYNAGKRKKVVL